LSIPRRATAWSPPDMDMGAEAATGVAVVAILSRVVGTLLPRRTGRFFYWFF